MPLLFGPLRFSGTIDDEEFFFLMARGHTNQVGATSLYVMNDYDGGVYDFSTRNRLDAVIAENSVALVPEINGSGFAYIAFILGALGLWLYSGAGRREAEGLAAS